MTQKLEPVARPVIETTPTVVTEQPVLPVPVAKEIAPPFEAETPVIEKLTSPYAWSEIAGNVTVGVALAIWNWRVAVPAMYLLSAATLATMMQ